MRNNASKWKMLALCITIIAVASASLFLHRQDEPRKVTAGLSIPKEVRPANTSAAPAVPASAESITSPSPATHAQTLRGKVLSTLGNAIPGARVSVGISPLVLGPTVAAAIAETTSAPDGSYSLAVTKELTQLPPSSIHLQAEAEGFSGMAIHFDSLRKDSWEHDFLLPEGSTVSGTVTDDSGALIPSGTLFATASGEDATPGYHFSFTRSGEDGSFIIAGVPLGYPITLCASAEGFATMVLPPLSAGAKDVHIVLARTSGRLSGKVMDSDKGKPVAGVMLTAFRLSRSNKHVDFSPTDKIRRSKGTVTRQNGQYLFTGLDDGAWSIVAENENGSTRGEAEIIKGASAELDLELPKATYVKGRFSGGSDMSGIELRPNGPSDSRRILTSSDGKFMVKANVIFAEKGVGTITLPFVLPPPWMVDHNRQIPFRDGHVEVFHDGLQITSAEIGKANEVVIDLRRGSVIKGRVFQSDGSTPAAGCQFECRSTGSIFSGTTDANGGFELALSLPEADVRAWGREGSGSARGSGDQLVKEGITIILQPNGSVSGRVTDELGKPMAGISVSGDATESITDEARFAVTDEVGSYLLEDLGEGSTTISLFVEDSSYASAEPRDIHVESGKLLENMDFVLSFGDVIMGKIIDAETREPLAEVSVDMFKSLLAQSSEQEMQRSDADGRFVLDDLPESGIAVKIVFEREGYETIILEGVSKDAGELTVAMKPAPVVRLKFLRKEDETPARRIRVAAYSMLNGLQTTHAVVKEFDADLADGELVLGITAPEPLWVEAHELNQDGAETDLMGSTTLSPQHYDRTTHIVHLTDGAKIRGRITDENGKPVHQAFLTLTELHAGGVLGKGWIANSGPDGSFMFGRLANGTHVFIPDKTEKRILKGDTKLEVRDGESQEIALHLELGVTVCGTVTGPDAKTIGEGGYVTIDRGFSDWSKADTDMNGHYCFDPLDVGEYEPYVMLPGAHQLLPVGTMKVTKGMGAWNIDLSERIFLSGSITLNGKPGWDLNSLAIKGMDKINLFNSEAGLYEASIIPGDYLIVAGLKGRKVTWGPFHFDGRGEQNFDFNLLTYHPHMIIDEGGSEPLPLTEVSVTRIDHDGDTPISVPLASHSVTLPEVPPGKYSAALLYEGSTVAESAPTLIGEGLENTFTIVTMPPPASSDPEQEASTTR